MARVQGDDLVLEPQGRILVHVDGADVTYFQSDGVTPLTIYDSEVGGSVVGQPLTTIYGRVEPVGGGDWWHEPGVRIRHVTHPDGRTLPPLRQEAYSALDAEHLSVVREAPLMLHDDRFGGDNTGAVTSTAALEAIDAYVGTMGADIGLQGSYLFATDPVLTKPGLNLRGYGRPLLTLGEMVVRADDFRASGLAFAVRAGVTATNARAIYIDPDGAGRDLVGCNLSDLIFDDHFYAWDFRGGTHKAKRIRCEFCFSDRQAVGNAGHFNFFNCEDVTTVGLGSYGGQNSASQNFGNGGGAITVIGGNDSDNDVSGGALNFENFFTGAKVTVMGGSWGWAIPSGTDAFAITCDDVDDVTIQGVDCGGYIRVQTSTGAVRRVRIFNSQMTRLRVAGASGTPQYIDDFEVAHCLMRGVPGFMAESGMSFDGNYLRRARVLWNTVKRYQADGVTENWTDDALSIARGTNLDMEVEGNDFRGQSVTASGSGGKIDFGLRNRNYSTLGPVGIVKAPPVLPVVIGAPTDAMFSEYELRNGMKVLREPDAGDIPKPREYTRLGDWTHYVELT
jgi:hypothetical protein